MRTLQSGDYLSAFTKTESYFFTVLSPNGMPVCAYLHAITPVPMSRHARMLAANLVLPILDCYIIRMANSVWPDNNSVMTSPSVLLFPT